MSAFELTPSGAFTSSSRKIAISSSSVYAISNEIAPTQGQNIQSWNTAEPNSMNGKLFRWVYNSTGSSSKLHLKQIAVNFGIVFRGATAELAAAANSFPVSPFPGYIIRTVNCRINTVKVCSITQNYFKCFMSAALLNYDEVALRNAPFLFHPWTNENDAYTPCTVAAPAASPQLLRYQKYVEDSARRVHVLTVPLADLLCMRSCPDSVFSNIRSIELEVLLRPSDSAGRGYRLCGVAADAITANAVCLGANMQIYAPLISASQQVSRTGEKLSGEGDENLAFYSPQAFTGLFQGGNQLFYPSQRYFDSVHIFQSAAPQGDEGYLGDLLLIEGEEAPSYGLPDQLCLVKRTNEPFTSADDTGAGVPGLLTAQISIGSAIYPQSPLILSDGSGDTFSSRTNVNLIEFLKSTGRLCDRDDGLPLNITGMSACMQQLYIRPYLPNLLHLDATTQDLIIRLQSGTTSTTPNITVVIWTLKAFVIKPDGMVDEITK